MLRKKQWKDIYLLCSIVFTHIYNFFFLALI